ncbi:MAG: hypothetical protein JWM33_3512 [Caulobacteraceae bacterium]|nr:hypothetical protein [Caulobacteraceae bacterium]
MRRWAALGGIAIITLGLGACVFQDQPITPALVVHVVDDETGSPIPGATVQGRVDPGRKYTKAAVETDTKGQVSLPPLIWGVLVFTLVPFDQIAPAPKLHVEAVGYSPSDEAVPAKFQKSKNDPVESREVTVRLQSAR